MRPSFVLLAVALAGSTAARAEPVPASAGARGSPAGSARGPPLRVLRRLRELQHADPDGDSGFLQRFAGSDAHAAAGGIAGIQNSMRRLYAGVIAGLVSRAGALYETTIAKAQ